MKNSISSEKDIIISRYSQTDTGYSENKSSNINVLLNRVKQDQKKEIRKKLVFSAAASAGILLFGFLIF